MFNITERVRRRMLRWLLVGVDPKLVRRALETINGGATKHGTVSIDASNITLPGTVELANALASDNTGSGLATVDTVGETVAAGDVLYLKADGKYWKAKADAVATMPGEVLAMEAVTADAAGKLLHCGYYRHDAWDFTVGNGTLNLLYVDKTTGGLVTQTAPAATGDQVQVIGYCVTADIIFFNPCLELVEFVEA